MSNNIKKKKQNLGDNESMITIVPDYEFLLSFRKLYPNETLLKNEIAIKMIAELFKERLTMEFVDCEVSVWRDNNGADKITKYGTHYNFVVDTTYNFNLMKKIFKDFKISMGNKEVVEKIVDLIEIQYKVKVKPLFKELKNYGKMVDTLVYDKKNFIKEYGDMFLIENKKIGMNYEN